MERFVIADGACAHCGRLAEIMRDAAGGQLDIVGIDDDHAQALLAQAYPNGWEHAPYLGTADYLFGESTSLCILPLNARFSRLTMITVPQYCCVPPHEPPPRATSPAQVRSCPPIQFPTETAPLRGVV